MAVYISAGFIVHSPMIRLLVFLGNPGPDYRISRHNAAWLLAERLPFYASLTWQDKFRGRYALTEVPGTGRLALLLPQTYMNLSGNSVRACTDFFKIDPADLLVVHDEVELPFGLAGFRRGGGLGGHNGLRSLQKNLGTADFWRFRIGIGRPAKGDVSSHVLGRFSPEEAALLTDFLGKAADILLQCAAGPEKSAAVYGKTRVV
jgi:PTH1 family peptidyl-tRNA hydrolase